MRLRYNIKEFTLNLTKSSLTISLLVVVKVILLYIYFGVLTIFVCARDLLYSNHNTCYYLNFSVVMLNFFINMSVRASCIIS